MAATSTTVPQVFVIGGANIDIQGQSSAVFRGGDSNPGRIGTAFGGVGRNVAEACLRLGLEVRLITVFGGDPEGERMEADCRAKGMDTGWSLRWEGPSARYLCALDADGSLVGAVADMEALDALVPGHLASAAKDLDKAFCIVADTNIPPPVSPGFAAATEDWAERSRTPPGLCSFWIPFRRLRRSRPWGFSVSSIALSLTWGKP